MLHYGVVMLPQLHAPSCITRNIDKPKGRRTRFGRACPFLRGYSSDQPASAVWRAGGSTSYRSVCRSGSPPRRRTCGSARAHPTSPSGCGWPPCPRPPRAAASAEILPFASIVSYTSCHWYQAACMGNRGSIILSSYASPNLVFFAPYHRIFAPARCAQFTRERMLLSCIEPIRPPRAMSTQEPSARPACRA